MAANDNLAMQTCGDLEFAGFYCDIVIDRYTLNGQLCLRLVAANHIANRDAGAFPGEPIATATVCLPNFQPHRLQEVAIKNWSENEGLYEAMLETGLLKHFGETSDGHRFIPVAMLSEELMKRVPKVH